MAHTSEQWRGFLMDCGHILNNEYHGSGVAVTEVMWAAGWITGDNRDGLFGGGRGRNSSEINARAVPIC